MPTVPRYGVAEVAPTAQPNFRQSNNNASAEDFGAGVGRAFGQLGGVVSEIAAKEKEKADNTQLNDANARLSAMEESFTDPNNPDGLYAHKGIDALGAHDALLPEYDKQAEAIAAGVRSRGAQERFRVQVQQRRVGFTGQINSYAQREKEQADAQAYGAFVDSGAQDLAKAVSIGDPNAKVLEQNLVGGIDAHAKAQGWPPQMGEATKAKALSAVYRNVIENTLASDPQAAQAQLEQFGSKLSFADASDLSAKMKPLVDETVGRAFVDHVVTGGVQSGAVAANSDQLAQQLLPCIQRLETGGLGSKAATAVSGAGAVGTFQMIPETAKAAAQRLNISFHPDDLKDPAKSAVLAHEELRFLCERFNNDPAAVLAGYNMGAGAAEGWAAGKPYQTQSGTWWHPKFPKDPDAMPAETRNYVRHGLEGGPAPERASVIDAINNDPSLTDAQRSHARTYYGQMQAAQTAARQDSDRAMMQTIYTKVWAAKDSGKSLRDVLTPDEYTYAVQNNHAEALTGQLTPSKEANTGSLDQAGQINQQFFYAAGNGTPEQQARARAFIADFNPYDVSKWQLTNEQRKTLGNQRTEFAAHDPKAMADVTNTGKLVTQAMFNTYGILEHPVGLEEDDKFNAFQASLTNAIQLFKADPRNHGAMPTQKDVQVMADTLVLQSAAGKPAFEPDSNGNTAHVAVPDADAALIRAAHPSYTDDQVRRLYLLHKAGGK